MTTFGDFPSSNSHSTHSSNEKPWEQKVLEDLAFAALKEQRKSRHWSYVFKGLIFLYLLALLILILPTDDLMITEEHTALVEINGVIAADAEANADTIVTGIRDAFENFNAKRIDP